MNSKDTAAQAAALLLANDHPEIDHPKNDPGEIRSWTMYDWANSVYSLVITTTLFPIYYLAVAPDTVATPFGTFPKESTYSYALALANFLLVLLGPLLAGIADARNAKRTFLMTMCAWGSLCCLGMFWFTGSTVQLGLLLFIGASLGWSLGEAFYNAFLPDIATPDRYDRVSAAGFIRGYIGSVILQVIALALVLGGGEFGLESGLATRIGFVITGVWWMGFGFLAIRGLRVRPHPIPVEVRKANALTGGFKELFATLQRVRALPAAWRFLLVFLCYDTTVMTIMYVATAFGTEEMKLDTGNLIGALLMIQLIAIPGARLMAHCAERYGNMMTLRVCVAMWTVVCCIAYFMTEAWHFYALAVLVGFTMGGIQSTGRATYSKLLPAEHASEAAFFSLYSVTDKLALIIGTLAFGYVLQLTGSMRESILFMIVGLALGFLGLWLVPWRKYTTANVTGSHENNG